MTINDETKTALHGSFWLVAAIIANSIEIYRPGGQIMPVMVLGIAIFLIWYSKYTACKGWIA